MSDPDHRDFDPASIVVIGLLGLAAAMGIGRFALTPLLPVLVAEGTTLGQGSALAAANYAGYLAGAVGCAFVHVDAGRLARIGLV
ncbi:MAG: YbfB/YjiJ family MFS transporter, partial [Burkholderiales bacterium]|nr:YbfB/YjiJ family MFS transporter [Burkholderiales bacterium]